MHARLRISPIPIAGALAIAISGGPAAAQSPEVQAEAALNVGYSQITQSTFQPDPMPEPEDVAPTTTRRAFTELRPGITLQSGRPRLYYRLGYQFSGNLAFDGGSPLYSNQGDASLVTLPSKYTSLTINVTGSQGGSSFLLSQRPAETGGPEIRAQGNPNLVSGSVNELFTWDAGRQLLLRQSLGGSLSAPQDDLDLYNGTVNGTLSLERVFKRFSAGLEVRASASRLRPLQADSAPYTSTTNAALVRFNHDFSYRWNGYATAGIEQVFTDNDHLPNGNQPLAILPTASAVALYTQGDTSLALDLSHGSFTNLQVGTVSVTDRITARGIHTLDFRKLRTLSFSAGFLHNEPIGESASIVAAGTGNAISGDAGFTTALTPHILGTARYSVAYQFGQDGGLEPILSHIVFLGVTGRYGNTDLLARPRALPTRGRRVDGSDGKGFPMGGNPTEGGDGGGGGDGRER